MEPGPVAGLQRKNVGKRNSKPEIRNKGSKLNAAAGLHGPPVRQGGQASGWASGAMAIVVGVGTLPRPNQTGLAVPIHMDPS